MKNKVIRDCKRFSLNLSFLNHLCRKTHFIKDICENNISKRLHQEDCTWNFKNLVNLAKSIEIF